MAQCLVALAAFGVWPYTEARNCLKFQFMGFDALLWSPYVVYIIFLQINAHT